MKLRLWPVAAASFLLALAAPLSARLGDSLFKGADPAALVVNGQFWLYPTGEGDELSAWSSPDLSTWKSHDPLLRLKDISWIRDGGERHYLWAPDMLAANGKYYLYYSVGPQNPTPSRLGVAVCDKPEGPCADSGKPLFIGGKGFEAIDPMVFPDPKSHKTYLYAGGSKGATLRVFELAPDLTTIAQEVKVDQPPGFTEGVFMHYRNGIYYLSYSSGKWDDASYSVRYALSLSPTGPWKYAGTILQSDKKFKGPGHHAFFQDPRDGSWLMAYGRWEHEMGDGPYTDARKVALARVTYGPTGLIQPIDMEAQ